MASSGTAVLAGTREAALACYRAALTAVDPARLTARCLHSTAGGLALQTPGGVVLARHRGRVVMVGAGKAALDMARAVRAAARPRDVEGIIVVPHGVVGECGPGVEVAFGAHPVPDAAGESATARLLARVAAADAATLVVVVVSGGASALLVAPSPGLTLADKQQTTAALLVAGADIAALNTVRKHCSRVKGGGLARAAAGAAALWTLVLSDVVGDDLATIASGPTVADPTTVADAEAVLARHLAPDAVPAAVRVHLARGPQGAAETVKPGDPVLAHTHALVVGGNRDAVVAAAEAAAARGYETTVRAAPLVGEAAAAGERIAAELRGLRRDRPVALIAGGETTVRVVPGGRGGRCQHLALAAARALAGEPAVVLAAGTDGIDGPTNTAGACVDGETVARAVARGLDPTRALAATDSHPLLAATGDLVRTGATGTNVADVVVALRPAC